MGWEGTPGIFPERGSGRRRAHPAPCPADPGVIPLPAPRHRFPATQAFHICLQFISKKRHIFFSKLKPKLWNPETKEPNCTDECVGPSVDAAESLVSRPRGLRGAASPAAPAGRGGGGGQGHLDTALAHLHEGLAAPPALPLPACLESRARPL